MRLTPVLVLPNPFFSSARERQNIKQNIPGLGHRYVFGADNGRIPPCF
jgi:hypothetical protein